MAVTIIGAHGRVGFGDDDTALYTSRPVTVAGGNGNDTLVLTGRAKVALGNGDNNVTMLKGGLLQLGSGNETITFGLGSYQLTVGGSASIDLPYGSATVTGGTAAFSSGRINSQAAFSGDAKLVANGFGPAKLVGGTGDVTMIGGSGPTTMVGGKGQDSMVGGSGKDVFHFDAKSHGGADVVNNFTQGQDKLYIERLSFSYLQSHNAISESGGNTIISLGGATIELHGITGLSASDITTRS